MAVDRGKNLEILLKPSYMKISLMGVLNYSRPMTINPEEFGVIQTG